MSRQFRILTWLFIIFMAMPVFAAIGDSATGPDWPGVKKLLHDQKFQAGLDKTLEILQRARAQNDGAQTTRALIMATQIQVALHGYENAVQFLKKEAWPRGGADRILLNLYYGHALMSYQNVYGWEIGQREKTVTSSTLDLKAWTTEQIGGEISKTFDSALSEGSGLDFKMPDYFKDYIKANNYPPGIRPTLRDAIVYLAVQHLGNRQFWSAQQINETFKLNLAKLLSQQAKRHIDAADGRVHPLVTMASWLGELEAFHRQNARAEAALEAQYVLRESLYQSLTEASDRKVIRDSMRQLQAGNRELAWWAKGQAILAGFVRDEDRPEHLIEARKEAFAGAQAFPNSIGGKMCAAIVFEIEKPNYTLNGMSEDAAAKRSVMVNCRNVEKLYFRAYPVDAERALKESKGVPNWTNERSVRSLFTKKPFREWSIDLPKSVDFADHRFFVTTPQLRPGMYVVTSSIFENFKDSANSVQALALNISDLVMSVRSEQSGEKTVRVLNGTSGLPVPATAVTLYRFYWDKQVEAVATESSDGEGFAVFKEPKKAGSEYWTYTFIARHGESFARGGEEYFSGRPASEKQVSSSLIYTDRSIYRPLQKIYFKIVSYSGMVSQGRFQTAKPGELVTVLLNDINNQTVARQEVKLGTFGTGSGEFLIPAGRPLGKWNLLALRHDGSTAVQVEEYKRPTFEAALKDSSSPIRLNRAVHLVGDAHYYFGLPVASGNINWRVTRAEVAPWWWGFWGWFAPPRNVTPQTVASGESSLGPDGTFAIDFTPQADARKAVEDGVSFNFNVVVDVTDEGGETRSTSKIFRIGFVTVEAHLDWENGFFLAGQPVKIEALLSNLDGAPRAGTASYRIVRLGAPEASLPADLPRESREAGQPNPFAQPGDRQRARWETEFSWESVTRDWPAAETLTTGEIRHDREGRATISLKPLTKSGVYRVFYETKDDDGIPFKLSRDFLVADSQNKLPFPLIALLQSSTVHVGESARLLIYSGLAGQTLTVETFRSGKRLTRRTIRPGRDSSLIEFPVTAEDRGGFTVLVSGLVDYQNLRQELSVQVPWDDRQLKLEFSTFRDKLRPGEHETFRVTVKDDKGDALRAGAAEVLAYMYDRSLDIFTAHSFPSIASLYPSRSGAPADTSTLGTTGGRSIFESLAAAPYVPPLLPDLLDFQENYGIGGPGRRGGFAYGNMMMSDGGLAMDRAAAPAASMEMAAAPKALQAEKKMELASEPPANEKPPAEQPAVEVRSNFSESAMFLPHLVTAEGGSVAIDFTVPDSVTSWKVFAHALTRDLRGGTVQAETKSVKELMVRPYVPRFLREGDDAEIKVLVNNASTEKLDGAVSLEIEDVESGKSVLADFNLKTANVKTYSAPPSGSASVTFTVRAPMKVGSYALKLVAKSKNFSDGEVRPFPVLPSRMHLAQSRFVTLKKKDHKVLEFKELAASDDPSLINEKLVVTVDAQLFYGVLQALPYLIRYPYECSEQTLNRFLSTGIVTSMFDRYPAIAKMAKDLSSRPTRLERFDDVDANRRMSLEETPWLQEAQDGKSDDHSLVNLLNAETTKSERNSALLRLRKLQLGSGGFPWFQGGPPDEYITLYLLMGFSRALEFHVDVPKDLVVHGWSFVRTWLDERLESMIEHDCCWEMITMVNYALSSYPDASWTGGLFDEAYRKRLLDYSFKHWKQHAPLVKGYLALTLNRMNRRSDAKLVWDSVMDSAKFDDNLGTFWAAEDRSWLWYNDTIDTHAFSLRVQTELDEKNKLNDGIVQWLFLNKKLNHWKSTRATAEVIYSLAHYLDHQNQLGQREAVKVAMAGETTDFEFAPDQYTGKKNQLVIPGEKVSAQDAKISVSKETPGMAFASATWQFSTDRMPVEASGDFFSISRRYFKRQHSGSEWTLIPFIDGTQLQIGDQIEVQLSVRTKHEAEYVHLRDPRAAGFEPETLNSGYKWDLGLFWYEETRDSGSNFFFAKLPVGEYTFKYRLRANMGGKFRVGPATIQSMYAPEFNAYSAGNILTVKP